MPLDAGPNQSWIQQLMIKLFGTPNRYENIELPNESGIFDPTISTYQPSGIVLDPRPGPNQGIYSRPAKRNKSRLTNIHLNPDKR